MWLMNPTRRNMKQVKVTKVAKLLPPGDIEKKAVRDVLYIAVCTSRSAFTLLSNYKTAVIVLQIFGRILEVKSMDCAG